MESEKERQSIYIPKTAWQNVQDVIAANQAVEIPTTLSIGPSTGTTKEQILPLLQKNYRLFQGFRQPDSYIGLVYNGNDEPWAEKQLAVLFKDLNTIHEKEFLLSLYNNILEHLKNVRFNN